MIDRLESDSSGLPKDFDPDKTRAAYSSAYVHNQNVIDQVDADLLETILSTIDDDDTVDELRNDSASSGRRLLIQFETDRAATAANDAGNFGEATRRSIEKLLRDGLADTTVKSFNSFKSELTRLVRTLPDDLKAGYPDSVIARHLVLRVVSWVHHPSWSPPSNAC